MIRKFCLLFLLTLTLLAANTRAQSSAEINGAYEISQNELRHVIIFADDYYVHAAFDQQGKTFKASEGGPFKIVDGTVNIKMEFDTEHKEYVDSVFKYPVIITAENLQVTLQGSQVKLKRIDDGKGALAGAWRISGRMQEKKFVPMPPGSRKTIKILSGTRFQWIAIDPKNKGFFGTGGGTYTFADGKYTESLEFFPRDNAKVGTALTFEDKIEDGDWYHTGKSSTGTDIFEIWKRASKIVE